MENQDKKIAEIQKQITRHENHIKECASDCQRIARELIENLQQELQEQANSKGNEWVAPSHLVEIVAKSLQVMQFCQSNSFNEGVRKQTLENILVAIKMVDEGK